MKTWYNKYVYSHDQEHFWLLTCEILIGLQLNNSLDNSTLVLMIYSEINIIFGLNDCEASVTSRCVRRTHGHWIFVQSSVAVCMTMRCVHRSIPGDVGTTAAFHFVRRSIMSAAVFYRSVVSTCCHLEQFHFVCHFTMSAVFSSVHGVRKRTLWNDCFAPLSPCWDRVGLAQSVACPPLAR